MDLTWSILEGLPPYGPLHEQFSVTGRGTHREGFVVEFAPPGEASWVGNFQPDYHGDIEDVQVTRIEGMRSVWVYVSGAGYLIDPYQKIAIGQWPRVFYWLPVPALVILLIADNKQWKAIDENGNTRWTSQILADNGFDKLQLDGHILRGDAMRYFWKEPHPWHAPEPFTVDLRSGQSTGGWSW
jgi:hypothetical protein